jgi:transposase
VYLAELELRRLGRVERERLMASDRLEKRRQVRRLVEEDGLSMVEAARRSEVSERSVIRWQAQDAAAGDPWRLKGEASRVAKERQDALSDEEKLRRSERARRAALAWSEASRQTRAAALGVRLQQVELELQRTLPEYAESLGEVGRADDSVGLRPQRLATSIKSLILGMAILIDKADQLAGFGKSGLVVEADPVDVEGDVASAAVTLLAEIRERRASA